MKYISFTFDDGRKDNYTIAYPIMRRYNLVGTLFCTTGYIDGTWKNSNSWKSAQGAVSVEEICQLHQAGWEIGLHGDKHTTSLEDVKISYHKLVSWGFNNNNTFGFSVPNSSVSEETLNKIVHQCLGKEISYIRTGRRINTKTISAKFLFGMYRYLGFQWAYNQFNNQNLNSLNFVQPVPIYCVVVKWADKVRMIEKFIEQMPNDTWLVLMFHSILPENHSLYGSDPWNWSENKFDDFCKYLANQRKSHNVEVLPMDKVLGIAKQKGKEYV